MIGAFITLAGAAGPVFLNFVYDETGSYVAALWAGMPLCLLSAAPCLFCLAPTLSYKANTPEDETGHRHRFQPAPN